MIGSINKEIMSKVNDRIISDLKSRQKLIDRRYGEGSTNKLIELSESLSSLYDERIKILFDRELSKDEKIMQLSDVGKRIAERVLQTERSRRPRSNEA